MQKFDGLMIIEYLFKLNAKNYNEKRPIQIRILSTNQNDYNFEYSLVGDRKNKKRER